MFRLPELPVSNVLSRLSQAIATNGSAVLVAPPGAGKTTLVPMYLLGQDWAKSGRIVLVEPRRIAARAAARRMASLAGEKVGQTVGFAVRLESVSSPGTRILVVTDGVFSRMVLDDPELTGVSAVLFDEFHERSLDCDFGLALALDIRDALRPDLKIVAMSATLDAAPLAELLCGAQVIESRGRSHPVDVRYFPRKPGESVEDAMAAAIRRAFRDEAGSILAFLPGRREINRTMERLGEMAIADVQILALHGSLEGAEQDAAIRPPAPGKRKIVLSTSLAESSITIDGVRIVIDSGLARQPKYDPTTGMTHLETVRVSRASADQRAGRAGRTEPGTAWRLWHEGQNAAMPASSPPAIKEADLSGLTLDCAAFGVGDPGTLRFLDPPPRAALLEARRQLQALGALDEAGHITESGRAMRRLPLPARLANMVVAAASRGMARLAAELAILISERGLGGDFVDLERRLAAFHGDRSNRARQAAALARRLADRAGQAGPDTEDSPVGQVLCDAFADRVAQARGKTGEFRLANGTGAHLAEADPLALAPFLVIADLAGRAGKTRILAAAAISPDEIRNALGNRIERVDSASFDAQSGTVRRREQRRLGALVLSESMLPPPEGEDADRALIEAIRGHGLDIVNWTDRARTLAARITWLHRTLGEPWPDASHSALARRLDEWLLPFLSGSPAISSITGELLERGLRSLLSFEMQRELETLAPTHFLAPTGHRVPIRYGEEIPVLAIRVQELYGLNSHPAIAGGNVPLLLELLSPAGRPVQTTRDLPGFWHGSWKDVRAQMRGRYPKHFWPERPDLAEPTTRAKPSRV